MPLQVWLPLTGDLTNNGLRDYSLTMYRGSEIYNDNGKIGKCFYSNGVNTIKILNAIPDFYTYSSYSLSAWFYIEAQNTVHSGSAIISAGNWNLQVLNLSVRDWSTDHYTRLIVSGTSWEKYYSYNFYKNTWYHVVVTSDSNKTCAYVNGTLIGDTLPGFLPTSIDGNDICIGGATYYGGMQFFGRINDVRIYDHALSPKEVKLLSQGLVAHYQLNDPYSTSNLIPNGFGQDGQLGWSSSAVSTTEIPPNQPAIKASYYSGNMTTSYIPISHATDYTINMYIKATSSATGNVYPSLYPYDVDKKFIDYYKCTIGFGAAYKTTLAQPLHKGDTVIYATNLSAWTTSTDNHYFHVAIFGYADSTGYVYPDMGYTADSPSFGSKTDKSNIDKTNNTITLLAPFTGEDRPAGTTICQATEGSTYFYPYGGIAVSTLTDWTYKTAVVDVNNTRLRFAKYVNFMSYWGAYYAGIQLIDNKANQIVYDSSGYNYHGKINTAMLPSIDTARNNISVVFNGSDNSIKIPFNTMLGLTATEKKDYTISVWTYKTDAGTKAHQTIMGGPGGFELEARNGSGTDPLYRIYNWGGATTSYEFNKWQHFCFVHTSSDSKLYVNGELRLTGTSKEIPIGDFFIGSWRDVTSQNYEGKMSDFRIYAAALSAEDVLTLYNAPVSVANNGAMLTQGEFVEI